MVEYRPEVDALLPERWGEGVDMPPKMRELWRTQEFHRESPSSIVTFLSCPTKWFLEYQLNKMNTGETVLGFQRVDRQAPNQWAVGGTLVHRALEVFYSEPPENRTEELLEEVFDHAWDCLSRGDWNDGIVSKSMVTEYEAMLGSVTQPVKSFKSRFRTNCRELALSIIDMERPAHVNVKGNEASINLTHGRMKIFGKIDREDNTLRGEVKIVDYKTGKSPTIAGDAPSVFDKTFLPAGIYALARTKEQESDISAKPIVGVQLIYLKGLEFFNILTTDDVLDDVSDVLDMVDAEMMDIAETGIIPTAPAASEEDMPCKWCQFRDVCPDWQ